MIAEINDCELMDAKIIKSDHNSFCLCLTYNYRDKFGNVHERVINNVPLPLYTHVDDVTISESDIYIYLYQIAVYTRQLTSDMVNRIYRIILSCMIA